VQLAIFDGRKSTQVIHVEASALFWHTGSMKPIFWTSNFFKFQSLKNKKYMDVDNCIHYDCVINL
jgi:hypothetical protein